MPLNVRPATVGIGEAQAVSFLKSGLPGTNTWVPTIVNPSSTGSTMNSLLWWGHILLHVVALGLSGFNGFGIGLLQKADATCTSMACYNNAPPGGVIGIAIGGSSCHVIGVVMILVGAAIWPANAYKKQVWFHSLLMFFNCFAMLASLLVWAYAATRWHSLAFWLSTIGVPIQLWSICLLFSTSAAIGSKNIIRTFVFTTALALDLMIALLYQVGSWDNFGTHLDPTWKSLMWVCFGTQLSAQVLLLIGRIVTNNKLNIKTISAFPFFRSVVLVLLAASAITSSFRFSAADFIYNLIITSFSLPATIFTWWTFIYGVLPNDAIYYPTKAIVDDDDLTEEVYDESEEGVDEEDGEAIEAKYRAPKLVGKALLR